MIRFFKNFIRNHFLTPAFQVYTDGSHKNGWGSWAFVVTSKNKIIHENSGRERKASSNQMEFQAALKALEFLPTGSHAELFTDSRILISSAKGQKQPKAFVEQTQRLQSLLLSRKISWHWVKAHSGVSFNERCDQLCILARERK